MNFIIPDFTIPFEPSLNPHIEAARTHTLLWIQRFGLIQTEADLRRVDAACFSIGAGRAYPQAELEVLELLSDILTGLLLWDDYIDTVEVTQRSDYIQSQMMQIVRVVHRCGLPPPEPQDPFARAIVDIWQRVTHLALPVWQCRFIYDLMSYLGSNCWEAQNRQQQRIPDLATYRDMRRETGFMKIMYDLLHLSLQADLPASVFDSREFQLLCNATTDIIDWVNDVYSLRKERASGDVHNLVLVLQQDRQCSLQEAVDQVCSMINEQINLFIETEQQFPSFSPEIDFHVQRYLNGLRNLIRGHWDWYGDSKRYDVDTFQYK